MSQQHHHIICKNCGHHYNDHFCSKCGQSAHTERIDYKYFIHDIPHSVLHVDKGFFYTLKAMLTRPGLAIKEYLQGKRVLHFKPFAFVIILSTIGTLINTFLDKLSFKILYKDLPLSAMHHGFWDKYVSLLIFLLIPLLALITWLTYKDKQYNYWEHVLGNTYIAAFLNVLLITFKLYGLIKVSLGFSDGAKITFFMFLYMFYYSFTFKRWMAPSKSFGNEFFRLLVMNFFISLIYITALSVTGLMTPWWNFHS